jgi:hypothetical protein
MTTRSGYGLDVLKTYEVSSAWSSRHAWAAHNPAIEKTVEPSTAGVRRRIVSTDSAGARASASDGIA